MIMQMQRTPTDDPGRRDDTPGNAGQQPGNDQPDTKRHDGPVGAPGPNDDDEGRGEDEGKGQDQRHESSDRTDSNGRNPGEPGYGDNDGESASAQ